MLEALLLLSGTSTSAKIRQPCMISTFDKDSDSLKLLNEVQIRIPYVDTSNLALGTSTTNNLSTFKHIDSLGLQSEKNIVNGVFNKETKIGAAGLDVLGLDEPDRSCQWSDTYMGFWFEFIATNMQVDLLGTKA